MSGSGFDSAASSFEMRIGIKSATPACSRSTRISRSSADVATTRSLFNPWRYASRARAPGVADKCGNRSAKNSFFFGGQWPYRRANLLRRALFGVAICRRLSRPVGGCPRRRSQSRTRGMPASGLCMYRVAVDEGTVDVEQNRLTNRRCDVRRRMARWVLRGHPAPRLVTPKHRRLANAAVHDEGGPRRYVGLLSAHHDGNRAQLSPDRQLRCQGRIRT